MIIEIGIERMKIVNEMAKLLTFADTKDDFQYVLERMHNELEEGIAEIDRCYHKTERAHYESWKMGHTY